MNRLIDLSGTNNLFLDRSFAQNLLCEQARLVDLTWKRDPWAESLRIRLAEYHNINMSQVCVGVGSSQVIDALLRSMPDRPIADVLPNFHMAKTVAMRDHREYVGIPVREPNELVPSIMSSAPKNAIIVISSPRNPLGYSFSQTHIEDIAKHHKGPIILDLAYGEFDNWNPDTILMKFDNLILVRTFSKSWGLPGIRVGYALWTQLEQSFHEMYLLRYAVGPLAIAVTQAALNAESTVRPAIKHLCCTRDAMVSRLSEIPSIRVWHSASSFICLEHTSAEELTKSLAKNEVRVAQLSKLPSYLPGWPDGIRISVPMPTAYTYVLGLLNDFFAK
jgi:histidinol-phosphate aminotransferase